MLCCTVLILLARPWQVADDKENDGPRHASPSKPAAQQDHADGSPGRAGGQPPADSSPQAEPPEGASPQRPAASPHSGHVDGSASAKSERQSGQTHDTARTDADGDEASMGGDVSDAEGSGADMWDEEDELDDAFRQERMAGLTQDNSGHGTEAAGEQAHTRRQYACCQLWVMMNVACSKVGR